MTPLLVIACAYLAFVVAGYITFAYATRTAPSRALDSSSGISTLELGPISRSSSRLSDGATRTQGEVDDAW